MYGKLFVIFFVIGIIFICDAVDSFHYSSYAFLKGTLGAITVGIAIALFKQAKASGEFEEDWLG